MVKQGRKGIAIVECSNGILVVSPDNKTFILPGGGARFFERRKSAAVRELQEEAGLKCLEAKYLFTDIGPNWKNHRGEEVKDYCKVFLIKAGGIPSPNSEIKKIAFWKPGSKLRLGDYSRKLIKEYLETQHK